MGVKKNKVIYGYVRCEKKICVNKYKPLKVPKILIGKQKCQICKNIMQIDESKHTDAVYKINDKSNDDQLRAVVGICFMFGTLILLGLYSNLF